jgi:CRISPR-associated protein Cas5a/b/c
MAGEVRRVSRYERWNALLDLLPGVGQLTVAEAASQLGVSQATIRRDLDQLAKQQLVTRTRGGATAGHVSYDLPLRYKTGRQAEEKQRIGRAAAAAMSCLTEEIASQPECWTRAIEMAASAESALPRPGERVAVIGCGSSLNVVRGYAALREAAGQGETDAFPASEAPLTRRYDRLVFVSRTGTTTEVLDALSNAPRKVTTVAVTADPAAPLARAADQVVWLDFSTERSVVSSRFITSSLVLLRAHLGEDVGELPGQAARELARPLPPGLAERSEFTFLGHGWAAAVADEAALKLREASRTWAESYPAMEYRHGPISVSDENTVVWALGEVPSDLLADAGRTGATVIAASCDPLAALIGAQRLSVLLAERKGIDPDEPRALARSVILA